MWKNIAGAPKVVPWVPVSDCPSYLSPGSCAQPDSKYMVYTLLNLLAGTGLTFDYEGKPLLLVTENSTYPVSSTRLAALSAKFTEVFGAGRRSGEPVLQRHRDIAASLQGATEDATLHAARHLAKKTGRKGESPVRKAPPRPASQSQALPRSEAKAAKRIASLL